MSRYVGMDAIDTPPAQKEEVVDPSQVSMFSDAPMARNSDRHWAIEAAESVAPKRGKIQQAVIDVFRSYGDMTAHRAERLDEFEGYRSSTIRKRISELLGVGILEYVEGEGEATYHLAEERINNPLPRVRVERCPCCQRPVTQNLGSTTT
jgi:hypothetical protein